MTIPEMPDKSRQRRDFNLEMPDFLSLARELMVAGRRPLKCEGRRLITAAGIVPVELFFLKEEIFQMSMRSYLFTSESVTEGHPDKVADQISDAVLDAIIAEDKTARVACETMVTTGLAFVAGEITTSTYVDIPNIVRETIKDIGYNDSTMGFDW
jgi:hypothetical protein